MSSKIKCSFVVRPILVLAAVFAATGFLLSLRPTHAASAMTYSVNSLADTDDGSCDTSPDCTLREAINAANANPGADAIDAIGVTGTINLTGALPDITDDVTINGPGANLLTVRRDTGGDYRIFNIVGDFNVTIDGLTISNGSASLDSPDDGGGGIRKEGIGTLTVTNSTVKDNSTTIGGGGIFNLGGTVNVTNSTLSGNSASGGGGVFSQGGTLTVTNSTLNNNSAAGGGIFSVGVTLTITNSTLNNNNAPFANGGGILSAGGGSVDIINSTLSGNSSGVLAGGILSVNPLTITNSTITMNRANNGTGGGIRHVNPFVMILRNTIVAGNFTGAEPGTNAGDIDGVADVSSSYNLIGTGGSGGLTDGTNNNQVGVINPGLGPLQNNGGPTQTHALLPASPAIDKGNSFGSVTDQRSSPRPVDLDDTTYPNATEGDASDIGAHEMANPDSDGDGVPDSADACPGTPTGTPVNASGCPQGECFAPPSGMVSWWPGDGNADDIQDGNNGTMSAGMTFVSGKVGQAFNADGSHYVQIPSRASLLPPQQITVDGWIKPVFSGRPSRVADGDTIIAKFNQSADGYTLGVAMDPTTSLFFQAPPGGVPLGTPAFFLNVGGIPNQIFGPTPIPNDGSFHLVAGTYDGTMMRLFLDGVEVASRPVTGSIQHAGTTDVFIGRESVFPRNSQAAIDEVELFNRALSQIEIAAIYNAGSAGKCKSSDECPNDPNKTAPGACGCGVPDTDSDNDGTPDCNDQCPTDSNKTAPGACGCLVPDTDSDNDGTPDCNDQCPTDPNKTAPGACGCGVPDTDNDHDGTPDCHDSCPFDPNKIAPGQCGCGQPDTDTDGDGTADCSDACPLDPANDADHDGVCGNLDNCPLVANSDQRDIDHDGIGDVCDPPTEACFVVDFTEITYFKNTHVITSSDAGIRTANSLPGGFNPSLWPYDPQGGNNKTKSRGTLFRIYGFKANQVGAAIPDADTPDTYIVTADPQISGMFYIELNGPARVIICPSQLQTHLIGDNEQIRPWTLPGTGHLTNQQKNVPGIMLNHNVARIAVPDRVRDELAALGMPLLNAQGTEAGNGLVDYIGFQLWGHGNADYREFVDVNIRFIFDDASDRLKHYQFGFHTAKNGDLESFVGCNYVDRTPGNDGVRFNDVWAGTKQNDPQWGPACGQLEPDQNQKVRENYAVPFNGMQILPTVNVNDDTLRIFFGRIRAAM